jgi:FkbM family methyltransferase
MRDASERGPKGDQTLRNRVREQVKLAVRGVLHKVDLELSRGPYTKRVARTLDARGIDALLDVGANVGQYAVMVRRAGFTGRMVSCEPLSGAYAQLEARARRDPRWTTLHTAVGSAAGTTTINVSANSFSSSLRLMTGQHLDAAPGSGYVTTETTDLTTVRDLVSGQGLEPARTLLKIDTQGYEDEVLAGAGDLLEEFAAIQIEMSMVELYEGQRLFHDHYTLLRDRGFALHIVEPGFSGPTGQMLQCDGLFVRSGSKMRP